MKRLTIYRTIGLFLIYLMGISWKGNCQEKPMVFQHMPADTSTADEDFYNTIKSAFLNPSDEARPKVYWWCLNGSIDTVTAKEELKAMKEAGITGFDIFEIGVNTRDSMLIPAGPAFMSKESLQSIKFVVDQAGELGLRVGLNLSSSWNAGGSWVTPKHAGKTLYYTKTEITGEAREQRIKLPFPKLSFPDLIGGTDRSLISFRDDGKPEYYEDIVILAAPSGRKETTLDTSEIINITPFFDMETEMLHWNAPSGDWSIYRYIASNSGQQVVLPSPNSAGLTIDHFDAEAVENHLMFFIDSLQSVLGDLSTTALESLYLASYEARGLVWTPTLPEIFSALNGYGIEKFLPAFFNPEIFDPKVMEKVQSDFRKTLSELMIRNLYKKSQEICYQYGLKINSEAGGPGYPLYNGPAEPLKAQGTIDIPRGEFWMNHSRFYKDEKDSIDVLRVVKETASASHIYEKGVVEMEAFTSFMHWQEGPGDMKPFGDRAFCEGMNRVVFHGFSHNISHSGYPGYAYYAGTHFNNKRIWWPKVKPFVDYLSRISAVLQKADFKADVIWYYGDKVPNAARPKNTHFSVGAGYDYEVINTQTLLENLTVRNGKLMLPYGAEFSVLVLENEDNINAAVLRKVDELVKMGALIIGEKPNKVDNAKATGKHKEMIERLWVNTDISRISHFGGNVLAGATAIEVLQQIDVYPDIDYPDKASGLIDYIHLEKGDTDVYFIRNTQNKWISRTMKFRQQNKVPELWDPVSGEISPVPVFNQEKNHISLPVSLSPYGSYMIVFRKSSRLPDFAYISGQGTSLPIFEYTPEGMNFLENTNIELIGPDRTVSISNKVERRLIDGSWEVYFERGKGAPEKAVFPALISWADTKTAGIKYYSGIGTYENTFHFNEDQVGAAKRFYLDLGKVAKVADVWLNGHHLGITWTEPHRFEVTDLLKPGNNTIRVEVANTWSNRLTGDALTGDKFTSTNIKATMIMAPTVETGDQTRYPWEKVPLIESGLLGPVVIQAITPVNINN